MLAQSPIVGSSPIFAAQLPRPAVVFQALSWQGFDVKYCHVIAACRDEATYRVRFVGAADINPTIFRKNVYGAFCERVAITSLLTRDNDVIADIQLSVGATQLSF